MSGNDRGHRLVPHTADLRVEAWAPTRDECIAETVLGSVRSFVDTTAAASPADRTSRVVATTDADLLVAVLDEVIYLMDITAQVPVSVALRPFEGGAEVTFGMVDARPLPQVGAVPKAVSLHGLRLSRGDAGWSSSVTLDV